jgi:hypothetical protein
MWLRIYGRGSVCTDGNTYTDAGPYFREKGKKERKRRRKSEEKKGRKRVQNWQPSKLLHVSSLQL